ncbi:MAG: hypothetical protein ABJG15_10935 [Hyphomonadaceae bacterium]
MASLSRSLAKKTAWSRTNPNTRLLAGAALIALVGLIGLTPKTIFGLGIVWPYAALWGAVGWASAGLSIRPMLILCVFGIVQDISFVSPFGSFMLVNLATYGAATLVGETLDVEADPVKAVLVAAFAMTVGFAVMWFMASTQADHAVRVLPRLFEFAMTLLIFVPLAPLFRLGGRPGERGYSR